MRSLICFFFLFCLISAQFYGRERFLERELAREQFRNEERAFREGLIAGEALNDPYYGGRGGFGYGRGYGYRPGGFSIGFIGKRK